jgi:hypothetical protein
MREWLVDRGHVRKGIKIGYRGRRGGKEILGGGKKREGGEEETPSELGRGSERKKTEGDFFEVRRSEDCGSRRLVGKRICHR